MSIQNLRDKSDGVIAKVIVGLIIVVFALFGMGSITTFLTPVAKVATVDGEDITQQEMEIAVERGRRMMLARDIAPGDIDEDKLRQDVLQNLINRKLLGLASEDMGLEFSDALLDEEIVNTPAFQVDGVFDPGQFQLVLGGAGYSAMTYRDEMRRDKTFQQLSNGIRATAFLTQPQVQRTSSLAQQTRDVAFLRVDIDEMLADQVISEDEISTYYASHTDEFMTEETVDVSYVELKREDLMAAVDVVEEDLLQFFEDTQGVYAEEERRRIAHILVEVNDEVTEADASATIDEVYEKVIAGGDFAELAKEYSSDPGSAEIGGDLGFNAPGTFVEAFEAVAYNLALNEMSTPVQTEFGFHLIKVVDVEDAKTPEFAEVRDRVILAYRENKAEDVFVQQSARMSELSFETLDLIEISEELGLTIESTGPVGREVTEGILASPQVAAAAFSSSVLLDGNNSDLLELDPNHHLVLHLRAYQPQEIKPLDLVSVAIKDILARQKAVVLAETQGKDIVKMLEDGSGARYVADQFGLKWAVVGEARRTQTDLDPQINEQAFGLPRPAEGNKSVGYATLVDGDVAVISVTNVQNKKLNDDLQDLNRLGRILASQQGTGEFLTWREGLEQRATVTRNN
ncbi:MAG: peptidyl-prolyl cis-trans isomerase D [Candidatus Pseudothioglobus sp.]|jgi:peptidyl-prolyl cis-trans isomerase D